LEGEQSGNIIPLFRRKEEKNCRECFVFLEWIKLVPVSAS
jgi:hypothetical protein